MVYLTETNVLLHGCIRKDLSTDAYKINKHRLICITTRLSMDPPQYRCSGGLHPHQEPFSKRMCCMLWTENRVPVTGACRCNRIISNKFMACSAQAEFTSVKSSRSPITAVGRS
ncbi:hypothetical protein AVEN_197101-1 [Araneus ventricosus]|uniref:Uncharacterized protein n=1 Tax=Araneus ventricosus TaxID=182803 RepID=A0A4Y2IY08_ARAVE|nr:hypothetical protein AVEN_197101-1 [Araneus ventricosus]